MTDHQQAGKQAVECFGRVGEPENRANKTVAPKLKPKCQQWSRGLLKLIFEGSLGRFVYFDKSRKNSDL
jgi:hypothetical protein